MDNHQNEIEEVLSSFKSELEEWSSNVEGTPTPVDLKKLDEIYEYHVSWLDKQYGWNQKPQTSIR